MKGVLMFAGIAGVVLVVALYYLKSQDPVRGQVINVEDGFPVDA